MPNYAAVILAAGQSSRMQIGIKALLPILQNKNSLELLIELYKKHNIENIFVVTGFHQEKITEECNKLGVKTIFNKNAHLGMFSSVLCALNELPENITHCFIQPIGIALIRYASIYLLKKEIFNYKDSILLPVFKKSTGHPIVIPNLYFSAIQNYTKEGGFAGAISNLPCEKINVPDENILFDIDNMEDYKQICLKANNYEIMSINEAYELLAYKKASVKGIQHAEAVAKIAKEFACTLNKKGAKINIDLVTTSALLHDICKGEKNHELMGANFLSNINYQKMAEIVLKHRDCVYSGHFSEIELVYLADKFVNCDSLVSIDERFIQKQNLYANDSSIVQAIEKRKQNALKMANKFYNFCGIQSYNLAKQALENE